MQIEVAKWRNKDHEKIQIYRYDDCQYGGKV